VAFILLQIHLVDLIDPRKPIPFAVLMLLLVASVLSWGISLKKLGTLRRAQKGNRAFMRAIRKAEGFEQIASASEQYRDAPLVTVFDFGYTELVRQVKLKRKPFNQPALERNLQLGASEEMTRLERHVGWLATIAAVAPFIGLFGTVWGIMDAFNQLSTAGAASLRAVGPGIADALVATAMGLAAAIPAAIFYNHFGNLLRELSARMDDFGLEFLNLTDRTFPE
jgi:biopolymer transport protein TolQ